jgi:hypothetical protein
MKHVQVPPDGEVLPLDPTTIFFRPADDDPLPFRLKTGVEGLCSLMGSFLDSVLNCLPIAQRHAEASRVHTCIGFELDRLARGA